MNINIYGCTGQIGQKTLNIIKKYFPQLKIIGLSKGYHGYPVIQDNETVGMILKVSTESVKAIPA